MKSLFFAFFIIAASMFSGVIIAEVSYFFYCLLNIWLMDTLRQNVLKY